MFQEWLKDYEKLREENNMSEEEIIEIIEKLQCEYKEQQNDKKYNDYTVFKAKEYSKGLQGLLDLYISEKEKNKKAKRYILEKQSIQYKYALSQIECEELLNILEE